MQSVEKSWKSHGLIAVGTGGNHSDARSGLLLQEAKIVSGRWWKLLEVGDVLRRLLPSLEFCIDGLDGFEAADIGGHGVDALAVDFVGGADRDFVAARRARPF